MSEAGVLLIFWLLALSIVRPWARLRAWYCGYFWLPCPRCGEMFGGHEVDGESVSVALPSLDGSFRVCCRRCSRELAALGRRP